jgi:hypothetical protein
VVRIAVESDTSALAFLQLCYRCPDLPIDVRIRAAEIAIVYERPIVGHTVGIAVDHQLDKRH